ncbi:MAG: hypothetical protein Q8N99_09100 [Nanoarchaeota archaeon]|nr:hypothetical protein [Nanoarchaeota archaeon]
MKLEEAFKEINRFSTTSEEELVTKMEEASSTNQTLEFKVGFAIVLGAKGREAESMGLYEQVLESQPNNPIALTNLGAYYMYKDAKRAFKMFRKVIKEQVANGAEKSTLALAYVNLGVLHENAAYYELAYNSYRLALKIDPANRLAQKYIADLKKKADPDYGLIGLQITENETSVPMLWDGSFIQQCDRAFGEK